MVATSTKGSKTPAVTSLDVTHTLASKKPTTCGAAYVALVATYGDEVAARFASAECKRLPRHEVSEAKGHKVAKPLGLMTAKQREAQKASRAAKPKAWLAKVAMASVKGSRIVTDANGRQFRVGFAADGTLVSTPVKASVVRDLPAIESARQVAASPKRVRRSRFFESSQPSAHLA